MIASVPVDLFAGLSPEVVAALAGIALIAGFIDGIAGGGGLLTVPSLVLAGLDPVSAIATNKLQGTCSTGSSAWSFLRAGLVNLRRVWPWALAAFAASIAGAYAVRWLPADLVRAGLPVLLIAVAAWFAFAPRLSGANVEPAPGTARGVALFGFAAVPLISFYDGAFGPGAGSFYMLAGASLLGMGLLKASAQTKTLNFASNLGSLLFFTFAGQIVWGVGLVMAVGAIIGGRMGSLVALRFGARLIRPLVVIVTLALAARLLLA